MYAHVYTVNCSYRDMWGLHSCIIHLQREQREIELKSSHVRRKENKQQRGKGNRNVSQTQMRQNG